MKIRKIFGGMIAALMAVSFAGCSLLGNTQTDIQSQLDVLNAKIELQAQEINVLKADKDELTETVNGLTADKETLSNEVNGLKADKDELTETVNGLTADKNSLMGQVTDLEMENETLSNTIAKLMPSAYEVFKQCNPDYAGTEEEWEEEYYADELMVDESLLEETDARYYTIEHVGYDNQILIHVDTYFMKTEFTVEYFRMVGAIAIEETTASLTESYQKSGNWPERYCKEYLITLDKHDKQNVADMANLLQGVPYVYAARPHAPGII